MKILYAIYGFKESIGGHFQSLVTIADAIKSAGVEVEVLCIGENNSPIITRTSLYYHYIESYKPEKVIIKQIENLLLSNEYDCIHCFDELSYYYLRKRTHKVLVTKCGGENPKFYPYSKYLCLFSQENLDHFKSNKKFSTSNIWLIPNRIKSFQQNYLAIKELRAKYSIKEEEEVLLKITRISSFYEKSIVQTIKLFQELSKERKNIKLLIIGFIQEETFFRKLNSLTKGIDNIIFISDKKYTSNPKELIDICTVYIGSGRSLMEASFMGKILAGHTASHSFPILLNELNLTNFLEKNFSERVIDNSDDKERLTQFKKILNNAPLQEQKREFSRRICKDYFDVEKVVYKYIDIYKEISFTKPYSLPLLEKIKFEIYFKYKLVKLLGIKNSLTKLK